MIILGLDISSKTIGIAVIEEKNYSYQVLELETIKPSKKDSIFKTLKQTKLDFINILNNWNYKFDKIIIEDISEHMQGFSNSKTILKLAIFNRVLGLTAFEILGIEPILLNVNRARSVIKPKNYYGKMIKEDVPEALDILINGNFPREYKKNEITEETFDRADAAAIAIAYCELNRKGMPLQATKVKKKKK